MSRRRLRTRGNSGAWPSTVIGRIHGNALLDTCEPGMLEVDRVAARRS